MSLSTKTRIASCPWWAMIFCFYLRPDLKSGEMGSSDSLPSGTGEGGLAGGTSTTLSLVCLISRAFEGSNRSEDASLTVASTVTHCTRNLSLQSA